jgi:uncharacterized membrane protein required for colicin V production
MEWLDVTKLAELLLTVIAAAGGVVGIVGLLKKYFGFADQYAQIASWIISAIMALLAAMVSGEITPELFTNPIDALVAIVMILLGVAKTSAGIYTLQKRIR